MLRVVEGRGSDSLYSLFAPDFCFEVWVFFQGLFLCKSKGL